MTGPRTGPCTADRHHTALAYQVDHCSCPDAREAYRLYRKRLREGRLEPGHIDSTGTMRRLQALAAIGWAAPALATRTGHTRIAIQHWRRGRLPRVHRHTHQLIADLYNQLWDTPGGSTYTRRHAARAGWAPPLAWDDQSIDDPTAHPDRGAPTHRARIDPDDVRHFAGYGNGHQKLADHLDIHTESIHVAQRRRKAS